MQRWPAHGWDLLECPAIDVGFRSTMLFFGKQRVTSSIVSTNPNISLLCHVSITLSGKRVPLTKSLQIMPGIIRVSQFLANFGCYWLKLWFSEAYCHHSNPFKRRYQTFKRVVNKVMDRTNTSIPMIPVYVVCCLYTQPNVRSHIGE